MRTIEHTIDIPAPPATVWRVLTATDRYGAWNPFIPRLEGELRTGARLRVTITPPGRSMTFKPTVLAVEENRLLRWRGCLGVPGIFDGQHEFHLQLLPQGGTRFVQTETFTGVLVPLLREAVDDTALGFAHMNHALKNRAATAPHRTRT